MSERDDRYARQDLPSTTAEFRAAPDASASTAQFKAFAAGIDSKSQSEQATEAWPEQPWAGESATSGSNRKAAIVVGAIVAVALVVTLIVLFG